MTDKAAQMSGNGEDPRARRTRRAIIDAFGRLVLRSRRPPIRSADVIAEAGVGRSTFYEHFSGADAVHMAAIAAPLGILADAAAGQGDPERITDLLEHFWENRARARDSVNGRVGDQTQRLLADLVEERLAGPLAVPAPVAARQLAGAAFAPLRAWLLGELTATPQVLAETLCRSGAALAAALRMAED